MNSNDLIKRSIIIGSIITIVVAVVFSVWFSDVSSAPLIIAPVLFTVASVLTIKVLTIPSAKALLKFSSAFMLTTVVKMLIFLAFFLVSYLQVPGEKRICFVVVFLLLHIGFTVIDTIALLRFFKDKENS
jgi:F0F1-type ATP synthase assembly protein I